MRSCSLIKFQALIAMLEQFKCDELTRALCWSLLKINVFDQQMNVKVPEIFRGAAAPQACTFGGLCPPTTPAPLC